jgi:S-adenosylmethionine hydrolase
VNTEQYTFIGPDNGILYEAAGSNGIENIWAVDIERFLEKMPDVYAKNEVIKKILEQGVSSTFHGRDLFAPLSGYILNGFSMGDIAIEVRSMEKIEISKPTESGDKIFGKVIYIDRFGNLITNIPNTLAMQNGEVFIKTKRKMISIGELNSGTMSGTYARVSRGQPLPVTGSRGYVEIAVNCGSAADYFGAAYNDEILVLKR